MVLFAVAIMGIVLGFGSGVLVVGVRRDKAGRAHDPKELRPVDMLLDQARWLPIVGIGHRMADEWGYPSSEGVRVPTVELEGGISLIASNQASDFAFLEHAGVRIGLDIDRRARLGNILKDRIADQAMADASVKLLGP
jgi:hypothetical protein